MILEKATKDHEVIVYQETHGDMLRFLREERGIPEPTSSDTCHMQDITDARYAYPQYQTWYIKRMLDSGWSLIGNSSGFIFSRRKKVYRKK